MKDKLTPEQSQRLIELGVDPSKASDFEEIDVTDPYDPNQFLELEYYRIFTLTDILSLLPKEMYDTEIWEGWQHFYLVMEPYNEAWLATYREYGGGEIVMEIGEKVAPELIDALFELLCWVLQNYPDKIKKL